MRDNNKLKSMIFEELTKNEIRSMISDKIDSSYSSRDFKKAVKDIAGDVIRELFKILWQQSNIYSSQIKRV